MKVVLQALRHAFTLLTVLPLGGRVDERIQRTAVAWFPVVGAALGLLGWGTASFLMTALPSLSVRLVAVAVLGTWAAATGGLHWDGLADVFDGWGVRNRGRDRILTVLRDPHIGSFAVVGMVFFFLTQWELVAIVAADSVHRLAAVPLFGRFAVVLLAVLGRPASEDGLAAPYIRGAGALHAVAAALTTAGVGVLLIGWQHCLGSAVAVLLLVLCIRRSSRRYLGGVTGDVLGFTCVAAETLALLLMQC